MFWHLPTIKNFARPASWLAGAILMGAGLCSCSPARDAKNHLQTVLHTRPNTHELFDSAQITNAIKAFGNNYEAAFAVLQEATTETNLHMAGGRFFDTNNFVRAGALYGMGKLGNSVPEVQPFLWEVVFSPSRATLDRSVAFGALKERGFQPEDIPKLAQLLSNPAVIGSNILTLKAPEAISGLIESNTSDAEVYLPQVQSLLDDPNPDTRFRAALALVKSEGASNPPIFSALHDLFQRPNNRLNEYYKNLAVQILGEAGPAASRLVPDLLQFSQSASEIGTQQGVYDAVARIEPDMGLQIPEVSKVLKQQQDDQMWERKWESGSYTLDDLRAALEDPHQIIAAVNRLAAMGAEAKVAVPDMIEALWGEDGDTRNKILRNINKIEPEVMITKVEVTSFPLNVALEDAQSVLDKDPATEENKKLKNSLLQIDFTTDWVLPEELTAFTNGLAAQAPDAYKAFVDGLKATNICPPRH